MRIVQNLLGQRFGTLVVLERAGRDRHGNPAWFCRCDCGTKKVILGQSLKSGATISCGCVKRLRLRAMSRVHGLSRTPTYSSWMSAVHRCTDPNQTGYERYGGSGIAMCARWLGPEGFEHFLKDMGPRPPGKSLDRYPDQNGDYTPGNCRWATSKEQNNNSAKNRFITHKGQTLNVTQWAEKLGLPRSRLYNRLRRGWPDEKILSSTNP